MNPVPSPYQQWVTTAEFARMMGRTPQWARKYAALGHFSDFGIPVLQDHRPHRFGSPQTAWFFQVSSNL